MKSWIVWGLILAVIVYGSFKGVAWYHVNRLLLQLKSASELHLAFRHGWIDTSITGEITVHDVEVTPFQLRKPLTASEVVIRFNSAFDLLRSFSLLSDDDTFTFPEQLEVEWQDVELPVLANWAAYLPAPLLQKKFFGLACGNISYIGTDELTGMGYDVIPLSARLSYDYKPSTNTVGLSVDAQFEGLGRQLASLDLQLSHPWQWPLPDDAQPPRLSGLGLSFEDKSFIRRVTLLCGKAGDYNQREFIQASVAKTKNKYAKAGITIRQPLLNAYGTFLQGDSVFELALEPAGSIELSALPFMSTEQISSALNASVKVNRVQIPQGDFLVNAQKLAAYLSPAPVSRQPVPKPVIVKPKPKYQLLGTEHIERFIGKSVRVAQRFGKTVEGGLKAADKHQLVIDVSQSQGKVLIHLDKANIAQFWVLSGNNLSRFSPVAREQASGAKTANRSEADRDKKIINKRETEVKTGNKAGKEGMADILKTIDSDNTKIIYEEGTDLDTPLAEGEYFEIIEVEDAELIVNPTINDLPTENRSVSDDPEPLPPKAVND